MVDRSPGLFDLDDRLAELTAKGDNLERLKTLVDFEMFRPALEAAVPRGARSKGGRPAFDHVLMFMYGCPRSRKMFSSGLVA
jgi:IS5 family transposase